MAKGRVLAGGVAERIVNGRATKEVVMWRRVKERELVEKEDCGTKELYKQELREKKNEEKCTGELGRD